MERNQYHEYITGPDWAEQRKRFFRSKMPKEQCQACGRVWEPGFHLHHRTYKRLGEEHLGDLLLMCADCHRDLHRGHKQSGQDLWKYTKRFVRRKRRKAWCAENPPPVLYGQRR